MGLIRLQDVHKQLGGQVILAGVTLDLHTNQTAALIGANGVGKTTLFRLIARQLDPDLGTVTISKDLQVGYLPQEPDIDHTATLRDAVAAAFADLLKLERKLHDLADQMAAAHDSPALDPLMAEYDKLSARFDAAGGYRFEQRLNEVLGGLGFRTQDYGMPVSALSGGQRCRAALAKLLLQERQFLLLDEPTNHLDIDAVRWLEKFLAGHQGGALIISHDRYLLDRLAERTIELTGAKVYSYVGNYSQFVRTRAERQLTQMRQYEQDREFIEKEQAYIAKHLAGQRTNQAKGRRTRLERRMEAGEFVLERPTDATAAAKIRFDDPGKQAQRGKEIVHVEGLRKQYDDKLLFSDLDLTVFSGQRLGITGPNGTGKTTLLKIVLGEVEADAGATKVAQTARVAYFAQDATGLDPERTVIDEIISVRGDFLERDARNYAARFLFHGEDPFKKTSQLSGGEQSRVRFMKLILGAPDVLILDEPTNHLDIPSREALESALAEFKGTVITVSHDRYFIDQTVERLFVLREEGHRLFAGNYSYYIEQIERERAEAEAAAMAKAGTPRKGGRRGSQTRAKDQPTSPFAKMKLVDLEAYIAEREEQVAEFNERFADPDVYKDAELIMRLRVEFDTVREELAAAEQAWLERAERE